MAVKNKSKILSVKTYRNLAGVSAAAISYKIKNAQVLPGISRYWYDENLRAYQLERDETIKDNKIVTYFRQKKQ